MYIADSFLNNPKKTAFTSPQTTIHQTFIHLLCDSLHFYAIVVSAEGRSHQFDSIFSSDISLNIGFVYRWFSQKFEK